MCTTCSRHWGRSSVRARGDTEARSPAAASLQRSLVSISLYTFYTFFFFHIHLSNRLSNVHPYEIGCRAVSEVAELEGSSPGSFGGTHRHARAGSRRSRLSRPGALRTVPSPGQRARPPRRDRTSLIKKFRRRHGADPFWNYVGHKISPPRPPAMSQRPERSGPKRERWREPGDPVGCCFDDSHDTVEF